VLQAVFVAFMVRHLLFVAVSGQQVGEEDIPLPMDTELPTVSVLVPCHNEASVVDGLVAALLHLDYPREKLQFIFVDDGSTDRTGILISERIGARPDCLVLRRAAGSIGAKSGALNYALSFATGAVLTVFDADHQPAADVLRRLCRHFVDPTVGAVQGRCSIRNPTHSVIADLIELDYLAGYLVNEYGRDRVFGLPAYGGANCAVRADRLRTLGGWNQSTVTEDTDLTIRLILSGQRVRYDMTATDTEEGVTTLRRYWRQRYRWARGHQQAWRDYRWAVWMSPNLTLLQKAETTFFLLAFHVPVASAAGIVLLIGWFAGLAQGAVWASQIWVLWTLLFLGPLLELSAGMILGRVDRGRCLSLLYFMPIFLLNIAVCSKAWVDGVLGRRCTWVKTGRASDAPATMEATYV
jgi:cellulose synthase/poly-beta-1,6-N-acetylglucosamine synthase-like glycosyltransferase